MAIWKSLLLVYSGIDVRYSDPKHGPMHFAHYLPGHEIGDALESFKQYPALVGDLTNGAAGVRHEIIHVEEKLATLSPHGKGMFWPSPDDTRRQIDRLAPAGTFDSIFVFWPQNRFAPNFVTSIPSGGWGLGMGASAWSNEATYATVANAPAYAWKIPIAGEVWLHEWLHGVCAHFAARGHAMPSGDADGASRHGYKQSPITGWTDYYRDLMTCKVRENGKLLGIPLEAWKESLR